VGTLFPEAAGHADADAPRSGAYSIQLFETLTEMLKELSDGRPTLIVLDNLHWADPVYLEFSAPELDSLPIAVLATYRHTELKRGHPLSRTLWAS
jgi:predicted ATPase